MQIPLNQFEQYIDDIILQRGLSYFREGCVTQFDEIAKGEFEAIVEGTEEYAVHLEVENNTMTEYSCTCPYEYGPVCKHIAAVLFYMSCNIGRND